MGWLAEARLPRRARHGDAMLSERVEYWVQVQWEVDGVVEANTPNDEPLLTADDAFAHGAHLKALYGDKLWVTYTKRTITEEIL